MGHVVNTLLGVGVIVLLGCRDVPARSDASEVRLRDSAGIRLVHLGEALEGLGAPCLGLEKLYSVGQEGSPVELFQVSSVRFLPSGGLAIGNAGTSDILVVDSLGELVTRFGGPGEGPGEFGTITSLHVEPDGSVVVYDDRQGRLTKFTGSGELVSTRRMAEPSSVADLVPLVVSGAGTVLAVLGDNRVFGRTGLRHDSTPLLRFSAESTVPDTVSRWATKVWSFSSEGDRVSRTELTFGPDLKKAGRDDRAALSETHVAEVVLIDSAGHPVLKVRWDELPRPVTREDYEAWQEQRRAELPETLPEAFRETLINAPASESHPVVREVFLDGDEVLWVAPTSLDVNSDQTWVRVDEDGRVRPCVITSTASSLLDATDRRIALMVRNEFNVETVEVLTFVSARR